MTETAIQTASVMEGALAWTTGSDACLVYPVGKQRARLLLAADLLSGLADRTLSGVARGLAAAIDGWESGRRQIGSDPAASGREGKSRDAAVEREVQKLRRELEQVESFDPDRYLYEVAKAVLLEETEFGQLTSLLRKHILERDGRKQSEVMAGNWGNPEGAWIVAQVSLRDGDLLEAVHSSRDPVPLAKDGFMSQRLLPVTWFLEWLMRNEALSLELGRSELKAMKALAFLEKDMGPTLRTAHRDIVRAACCLHGLSGALELVQGARNGPVRLRLRSDYVASFLPAFSDYRSLAERFDRAKEMDLAGLVVVGMGGSGKTTFLRRCYDILRADPENRGLSEEIDPKSTAFVVGHMLHDISVPLFDGRKRITLCWMDTAGSEDYRLLGQQLTVSVREMRKMFPDRPVDYNILFMWSYEPGYDPARDAQAFEDVLTRFMDEVKDLGYFDLDPPRKVYLLLNKADTAALDGVADRFSGEHERRFRSVMESKSMAGESLGFVSTLGGDAKQISDRFLVTVFGLSDQDWKQAFVSVRAGINQGVIGNLLEHDDAGRFKREVYDRSDGGQEAYLRETVAWIDRFLDSPGKGGASTRALLRSLRAFLAGEMEGDAVA